MELYYAPPSSKNVKKISIYALFVVNIAVIFALWWGNSGPYVMNPDGGNLFVGLGRIFGLLAEYFLLVQLMLVGRVKWIEHVFGFDRLNAVHRFIGYSIPLFLISHVSLLTLGYAEANGLTLTAQFIAFLTGNNEILYALVALFLFLFVIGMSIAIVRRKLRYETWYFVHLSVYLAILLALQHQLGAGDLWGGWALSYWYALNFSVFGFVLAYRFVRPLYFFGKHRFVIEDVVAETPDTYSLYITGKNMEQFKFEAGQYANITLLARGMWYTHPFSFSTAYNGKFIRFTIKSLGDYTSQVRRLKPGTKVIIDGPLGLFVEERALRKKFLLIAGGIGVTPLRSMVESLAFKNKDAVLLYGGKTADDLAFKKEFESLCQSTASVVVHYILSTQTPHYESGYIDKEKIARLVPDFATREVFLCGPPPMMKATVENLSGLGFSGDHIHFEKFSF
ncbi:MAG: ferredoxin reductase family protein [Patescibacteria group bacterium]